MDQSQLEELGKQMRAFQPEIVIKGREDPSDILRQVLVLWPGLLYYLKQYRVWTGPFQSRVQLAYRNREYPWRQVLAPEAAEVEEELRRCVMRYQKKAVLVLPKSVNMTWILQCFMNQTVSFYPNTKSYAVSSWGFPDIPYTVYEVRFTYWLGTVMLRQMEEEVDRAVRQLAARLFPIPMPDSVRCQIAHHYLACTVEYCDEDHGSPLERSFLQSAYGALIRKRCVCQGIAEAYKRILNQAGIPCDLISGKILDRGPGRAGEDRKPGKGGAGEPAGSREGWHAWNIVHLNGGRDHCHVDATWDIGQRADMRYFLIGDADLAGQREWKRHYYTPCGDGKKLRGEALDFCVLHRGDLMRAGLRPEWIS